MPLRHYKNNRGEAYGARGSQNGEGKETVDKAAERERQKQARDTVKATHLSRKGNKQVSRAVSSENKRHNYSGGALAVEQACECALSLPPKLTSRWRNIMLPTKFK
jgi:hypothetical protein